MVTANRSPRLDCGRGPFRKDAGPIWALALLTSLGQIVGGCGNSRQTVAESSPTKGAEMVVRRGDLVEEILLTGELQAEEAVVLAAPNVNIWPITVRFLMEDGAAVAQGDIVAEFDNSQLLSTLEDVRTRAQEASNLLSSERSRVAAKVSEALFEVDRRRAAVAKAELAAAVPSEIVSSREHAEAQLKLQRAELGLFEAERALESVRVAGDADIRIQQIALERARDAAQRTEASLGNLNLIAPRGGISVRAVNPREDRPVREGDAVWPGLAVARLPDLETLQVKARLFDVDDGRVSPGQEVWATLDAFPESRIGGRVRQVDAVADESGPRSARRFFDVTIDLDQIDSRRWRPGMSVKIVVRRGTVAGVLLVQREALDLSGDKAIAALADGDVVEIGVGPCSAQHCVVLEGLEEGTKMRRLTSRRSTGAV